MIGHIPGDVLTLTVKQTVTETLTLIHANTIALFLYSDADAEH